MRALNRVFKGRARGDQPTLPAKVKRILKKYGATLLMPGPAGILQYGFQPGNYRESTGQNLAAADQQVGLAVDAAQSPGPELMTNGDFSNGLTGWSSIGTGGTRTVVSGRVQITGGTGPGLRQGGLISGRTYRASMYARRISGTANAFVTGGGVVNSAGATVTWVFNASATNFDFGISGDSSTTTWEFGEISVRELPGIHASQPTSGFQPYLRQVPKTLGPELVVNGAFDSGIAGWINASNTGGAISWNSSSAALNVTNTSGTARARQNVTVTTGAKYVITLTTSARVGSSLYLGSAEGTTDLSSGATVVGQQSIVVTAITPTLSVTIAEFATGTTTVDNISVREVLEWTYVWQFDGTDDRLSLSAVPFQTQDVSFAIVAFMPLAADGGVGRRLFEFGGNGSEIALLTSNAGLLFNVRGDTGNQSSINGGATATNTPFVATCIQAGSSRSLRVDSVPKGSNAVIVSSSTANAATLGNRAAGDRPFNGPQHIQIFGKGAITEAELLSLEKFIAKLQGRSL